MRELGDYEAPVRGYDKSLEIEPGNAASAESLRAVVSKLVAGRSDLTGGRSGRTGSAYDDDEDTS